VLGPALHTHVRDDEVWYVLQGRLRFKAGDEMFWVPAGDLASGPRGTPHTFQNVDETPARLLVITAPAGPGRVRPAQLSGREARAAATAGLESLGMRIQSTG
jgi:mannose-6-phosphate isomerase-like protein (cupin superfamily)